MTVSLISAQSQVGLPTASGYISTLILTNLRPGDLLIGALVQDEVSPSDPTFTDATWTPLVDLNTGGMWLGYRFWNTGDSDRFQPFTPYLHIAATAAFRPVSTYTAPMTDHISQAGNSAMESTAFAGALVDAGRDYLYVNAGMTYHQSTGLVVRSPLLLATHIGTTAGGNPAHVSSVDPKELLLGYLGDHVANGSTPHYYIDGLTVDAGDGAETLSALFVSRLGGWTVGYLPLG